MSTNTDGGVQIAVRVSRALYARILERQREAKRRSGIEPSLSSVVRVLLEEATVRGRK